MLTQVYRSPRKQEMYLYVDREQGLDSVPKVLLEQFGEPEPVMLLRLDQRRSLARVDIDEVRASLAEQGYFLQLPPTPAQLLARDRSDG